MKTIMSSILTVWIILAIGLLSVQTSEAAIPEAIDLAVINPEGQLDCNIIDCNLLAIATNPGLLKKIDQRKIFNSDDMYRSVLNKTLDIASKFVPYDVNEKANLTVSLCLADSRVYFWNALYDRNMIGWIDIPGQQEWGTNWKPKMNVWVIPRLDKISAFTRNWSEYTQNKNVTLTKALIKLALAVDIEDTNSIGEQVHCKVKIKAKENHSAKIFMNGNFLQAEIMLLSDEQKGRPTKYPASEMFIPGEGVLKDTILILPFWPPKIDDIKKDSSN